MQAIDRLNGGNFLDSQWKYDEATRLNPDDADAQTGKALVYLMMWIQAEAEAELAKAHELGLLGVSNRVDDLILNLTDEDPDFQCGAARSLGRIGDPTAVDSLIVSLKDEDQRVWIAAAEALEKFQGE